MVFECTGNFKFWVLMNVLIFLISFQHRNGEFTNTKSLIVALKFFPSSTSLLNVTTTKHKFDKHFLPCCHVHIQYYMQNLQCYDFVQEESFSAECLACLNGIRFLMCISSVFSLQVGEIIKIMKAYINMIVKKRCSVKSATSVDSHASIWTR